MGPRNVYKLADGTWSSDYKVGDKFLVTDDESWKRGHFTKGSVIELIREEYTLQPLFKLIDGKCGYKNAPDGGYGAYTQWGFVSAYKPHHRTPAINQPIQTITGTD